MHGAQDFDGLGRIGDRGADERLFPGPTLTTRIARRAVPDRRHDGLVVLNLAVLDVHPVAERAAWGLGGAPT